jgi:antitoxin component YwqK of YwqJK toxin-antitoxin module
MNKKKVLIASSIVLFLLLTYFVYSFIFTSYKDKINPIYLIPEDAVFIIDTKSPINTWDEISNSPIWNHLQKNTYFKEITESLNNADKSFKEQKKIIQFIGERDCLISIHVYQQQKYDLFYTVDIQNISKLNFLKNTITKLAGENFKITKRQYHEKEIIEIFNKEKRETLYLSFIKNQLIASYTHVLIENSIDQYKDPKIGRNLNFIEINKETTRDGLFRFYTQYKYLNNFISCFTQNIDAQILETINNSFLFSGFDVLLKEDNLILAEGYTNFNNSAENYLNALQNSGKGERTIAEIAPKNTALYSSISFDGFNNFHKNLEVIIEKNKTEFSSYTKQISEIEKMLSINIKEQLFSWVGDEIGILHINDVISKKEKNIAFVLTTNDIKKAKENLGLIIKQIKEKTPLKFKQINYKNHVINFLDLKGFFKILVGKMFTKIEKPYFTIIDDYVIFSNKPNTLKEIINNKLINNTLASSDKFNEFNNLFEEDANFFTYINTPYIYGDLLSFTDYETKKTLQKNKDYIISFSQLGLQLSSENSHFESYLAVSHQDPAIVKKELLANSKQKIVHKSNKGIVKKTTLTEDTFFMIPEIFPTDLSASSYKKYTEKGILKFEVELKNGLKHGDYKEYYKSGNLKIKGKFKKGKKTSTWKGYSDENERILFKKRY